MVSFAKLTTAVVAAVAMASSVASAADMISNINVESGIKRVQYSDAEGPIQHMLVYTTEAVATPPHPHAAGVVKTVLKGQYSINGQTFGPGDKVYTKPGQVYTSYLPENTVIECGYLFSCNNVDGAPDADGVVRRRLINKVPSHVVLTGRELVQGEQVELTVTAADEEKFASLMQGGVPVQELTLDEATRLYATYAAKKHNHPAVDGAVAQ